MEELELSFKIDQLNDEELESALMEVTAKLMFCGARYTELYATHATAKMNRKTCEKHLYKTIRLELQNKGVKPTEKMLEAEVETNQEYLSFLHEEVIADGEKTKWYFYFETLKQAKESIVSRLVHIRHERQSNNY